MPPTMNIQLQRLLALQELDHRIRELKETLALIPGQVEQEKKVLEGKKGRLNALQEDIQKLQKQRNQMEQEVKAENDRLIKTQQKLPAVKTNQEYRALLTEIDTIKESISGIEDQELEILEVLEEKEAEVPEARREFEGFQKEFAEYQSRKEAEQARVRQELEEAGRKRESLVAEIDPKLFGQYEKVLKRKGDSALAQIKGDTCQGCYQQIQPQIALEVRTGGKTIHVCQFCQRFLYPVAEPTEETQSAVPK